MWSTFHEPDQVEKAFQRSFDNLNLGYIDLYLMHHPVSYRRVLLNIRLPSDDVNAFHVFPVDKDGKNGIPCSSLIRYRPDIFLELFVESLFMPTPKMFCN